MQVSAILKEKYDGDIPRTFEELMELPGIGPKMVRACWGGVGGLLCAE